MKKLLNYVCLLLLCALCNHSMAQVVVLDLTTGIDASNNLIPVLSNDDNWTVCPPSGNHNDPSAYVAARCGSGIMEANNNFTYGGKDPLIRWLCPFLNNAGEHKYDAPSGYYYYRYTFDLNNCDIASAVININHIGADNCPDQFIVNGNVHPFVNSYFPYFSSTPTTVPLSASELIPGQQNEILLRVYNVPTGQDFSYTGMELKGDITIQKSSTPNASFHHFFTGTNIQMWGGTAGNETWKVYASATGNPGTYGYVGTYNAPVLAVNAGVPCYFITHTVATECGTSCHAESICNLSCSANGNGCAMSIPRGLTFDQASRLLSWNPVDGAISYIVQVTSNDPACCNNGTMPDYVRAPKNIAVSGTSYSLNYETDLPFDGIGPCFSWRVIAICGNGETSTSPLYCSSGGAAGGGGDPLGKTGTVNDESNKHYDRNPAIENMAGLEVTLFPNPANGEVSIDITALQDVTFSLRLFDINGKLIRTSDGVKTSNKKSTVKWLTESLSKGVYQVQILTSDHQLIVKKLAID